MEVKEAIILTRQLRQLQQERPNSVSRFSAAQNFAIDWSWKNLAEANFEETIIPPSWLNNYERACTAAQLLVDNLPQFKVEKIDKTISNSSETKSENRPDIPQPVKTMGDDTSGKEISSQDVAAGPMTAQQISALVSSIMQNLNVNNPQSQK
ncbi:hypothetical protein K3495_g17072, partial [Podosphaera aphanis]